MARPSIPTDDDVVEIIISHGGRRSAQKHSLSRIRCFQDPNLLGSMLANQFNEVVKEPSHVE
jgi:hypothetical protein